MADSTKSPRFGGALKAAIQRTEEEGADTLSVDDAGSAVAFLDAWSNKLVAYAHRLKMSGRQLQAPVVLLYTPDTTEFAKAQNWSLNPFFGTAPTDELEGLLAVATYDAGGAHHPVRQTQTAGFLAEIEKAGLGACLTIALMDLDTIYVWMAGVQGSARHTTRKIEPPGAKISLAGIKAALDSFYDEEGKDCKAWWSDTKLRITVDQPERAVQTPMRVWLVAKLSGVARVREEQNSGNGRMDITIVPKHGGAVSAVLELKTIRERRRRLNGGNRAISERVNTRWAKSGVQQAASYRDREQMNEAILCIYDFCKSQGGTVEASLDTAANHFGVHVYRYWVSATSDEYREAFHALPAEEASKQTTA